FTEEIVVIDPPVEVGVLSGGKFREPHGFDSGAGDNNDLAGNGLLAAAWIAVMNLADATALAFEMRHIAVGAKGDRHGVAVGQARGSGLGGRAELPQEGDPSGRFVIEGIAIAVDVGCLRAAIPGRVAQGTDLAPARSMILGDDRLRGPVRLHSERGHANARVVADGIWGQGLLIIVLAGKLYLILPGAIDADELLRLRVVGFKLVVRNWPIPQFPSDGVGEVSLRILAVGVEPFQFKIKSAESQGHAAVMLGAAADTLTGVG